MHPDRVLPIVFVGFCCLSLADGRNFPREHSGNNTETGTGDWAVARAKATEFVAQLTLAEKVAIATGNASGGSCIGNISPIERIGFAGICYSDGPTAINRADLVSIFPAGLTAAATWDKDLIYRRGVAIGEEFKGKGMHVQLGPVAGPLGRHPLGGRNWEGFSPDPYLTGIAMDATIRGVQSVGVQTCSKHYIGNEQETQRSMTSLDDGTIIDAVSANIDDRTMHELYLWPFASAVKAGTASVMCSYNRMNQTYSCENSPLLNDILKTELGFEGYVVSDWFATHSTAKAANAGLDLEMPGVIDPTQGETWFGPSLLAAVNNGSLPEGRLDDMAKRIMTPYFLLNQDSADFPTPDPSNTGVLLANELGLQYAAKLGYGDLPNIPARDVRADHADLIREIGAAGTVLLKNVNGTLPLASSGSLANIGIFGNDAADIAWGLATSGSLEYYGYDIGTLPIGGGSGSGRFSTVVSPVEAIKNRAAEIGARVQYILDNKRLAENDFKSIYPIPDVCLVFLKTWAQEGVDRLSFKNDHNSTVVVNNVAGLCPNTVVITHSGGVNTMPWANLTNVQAILAAHYPGEQTGNSIVDILWGNYNPAGKLPYTIPADEADYDFPIVNLTGNVDRNAWQSDYTEGQLIDYRHFDAFNLTPLYEFGFGLSYTTFEVSSPLKVTADSELPAELPDSSLPITRGGNPDLWNELLIVSTSVSNTGAVAGHAVPQLYVSFPSSGSAAETKMPVQACRGFEKIYLEPGERKDVVFNLTRKDLSIWDSKIQQWRIPTGNFTLKVGFSSRDIKKEIGVAVLG